MTSLPDHPAPRVAVLLPCYNEAAAIERTISGFRAALPSATIYVYDNNSNDGTVGLARAAGADIHSVTLPRAVSRAFRGSAAQCSQARAAGLRLSKINRPLDLRPA